MPVAEPEIETITQQMPPYHVLIENDDFHSFMFVVAVVQQVFAYPIDRTVELVTHAHQHGEAIVWTGSKEVAELKLEQITTFSEQRDDGKNLGPLSCRLERST
jgi:ATP-dependent Clp protease adaptor protein ClpS